MLYAQSFHIFNYKADIVLNESTYLVALLFENSSVRSSFIAHNKLYPVTSRLHEKSAQSIHQKIQKYCKGKTHFVLPQNEIDICIAKSNASAFEKNVLRAVLLIPYGSVTSYANIARSLGLPRAARAVGNTLRKNTLPILIPCHRVVLQCHYDEKAQKARKVKNYLGSKEIKEKLLRVEKAMVSA